jgi:transcriptional regulator with XRE-family HTH domain
MSIGTKIKYRRTELDLTLEQLGNMVGVGKSTVRKWETGDIANMKRDKIALLAKALNVSPTFLMDLDEDNITQSDSFADNKAKFKDSLNSLSDEEILNLAAHRVGYQGKLSKDELEDINLAIRVALARHNKI